MTVLVWFVVVYLAVTIAIGLWAARRVSNSKDYLVAGRKLPLYMSVATVFATWFGAETVLAVSSTFLKEGLRGIVADPFGFSLCLILVAVFFARAFYRMDLLTIGDFYRKRYGGAAELVTSLCITISYLGWTSAQMIALGLVFNTLSGGAISMPTGIMLGAGCVLVYTLFGGMWSVAFTDIFQTVIIVAGLLYLAWLLAGMAGGAGAVIAHATAAGKVRVLAKAGDERDPRVPRRLPYRRGRRHPAAGRLPARHLGQGREDRGARVAARRHVLLRGGLRADLPRLLRIPHRTRDGERRSSRPKATAFRRSFRR